ncbi:MAG: peptide chain release factor N(5)-glutamine methyltransferase [Bdellovibrionota bacterium]
MSFTYKDLVLEFKETLKNVSSIPEREIEILIEFLTKKDRIYFIKNPDEKIPDELVSKLSSFIKKREKGYPLEYTTHNKEFYGLNFYVDRSVLIPRPETEMLVEEAYNFLKFKSDFSLLDLGTGSGCIAIALANLFKYSEAKFKVVAVDKSFSAIKIARRNATNNKVKSQIQFKESDWFENINEKFDCIVSNPPYVKGTDKKNFPNLTHEPAEAIYSKEDGLADIKFLLTNVSSFLNDGGIFLCEFGYNQKEEIEKFLKENTNFKNYEFINDLAKLPRVLKVFKESDGKFS